IPMTKDNHIDLAEHIKQVATTKKTLIVDDFSLSTNEGIGTVRIHIRPMPVGETERGALVMFEPVTIANPSGHGGRSVAKKRAARKSNGSKPKAKTKRK